MSRVIKSPVLELGSNYEFILRGNEKVNGKLINIDDSFFHIITDLGEKEIFKCSIYFFKEIVSS